MKIVLVIIFAIAYGLAVIFHLPVAGEQWLNKHHTLPKSLPAAHQAPHQALTVPNRLQLGCDTTATSANGGISDCTSRLASNGDEIAFYVENLSRARAAWLCRHGFDGRWSLRLYTGGKVITYTVGINADMCQAAQAGTWQSGDLETGIDIPQQLGSYVLSWQLTGPSGLKLTTSTDFRVAETYVAGQPPS